MMIARLRNPLLGSAAILVACLLAASVSWAGGMPEELAGGEIPCVHQVEKGETLSSIAKKFLGDAGRWGEIAAMNPHIADPNRIVAGQSIELPCPEKAVATTVPTAAPAVLAAPAAPAGPTVPLRGAGRAGTYHVTERQYSFITPKQYPPVGRIVGEWDHRKYYAQLDEIYLDIGEDDDIELRKGDRFTIYRDSERVEHPKTGKILGHLNRIVGDLEITRVEEQSSVGRIIQSYADIHPGDKLRAFLPLDLDVAEKENTRKLDAYIVGSSDEDFDLTDQRSFFIDKGSADGIEVGNLLTVYQAGDLIRDPVAAGLIQLPREYIGKAIVFRAEENTSSAWIVNVIDHFQVGDIASLE